MLRIGSLAMLKVCILLSGALAVAARLIRIDSAHPLEDVVRAGALNPRPARAGIWPIAVVKRLGRPGGALPVVDKIAHGDTSGFGFGPNLASKSSTLKAASKASL